MLINFRLLSQESFDIDASENDTIADVKAKIFAHEGYQIERQKLIHDGKILENEMKVSKIEFSKKKFVVLILAAEKTEQLTNSSSGIQSSSDFEIDDRKYRQIVSDGYTHEEAVEALTHAKNDFAEAIDYIVERNTKKRSKADDDVEAGTSTDSNKSKKPKKHDDKLNYLKEDPVFRQLRDMVQLNPALLPQVLSQMAEHQPGIVADIRKNPSGFLELINEHEAAEDNVRLVKDFLQRHNNDSSRDQLNDTDKEAIERLSAMGFAEALVMEAFLACDKNEEYAINYILQRIAESTDHTESTEHQ